MATSGVEVDEKVSELLDRVKTRKQRISFFKISDDNKRIEACETGGVEMENLVDLKTLPEEAQEISKKVLAAIYELLKEKPTEPRYIYFNIVLVKEGRNVDKMVLVVFNPDNAKIKSKMLYSSSKDALKKVITTTFVDLTISDLEDMTNFSDFRTEVLSKGGST